jgi:hypothetical protein
MVVMQAVDRRSFAFAVAFVLVSGQFSQVVAQSNRGTHLAAAAGDESQVEPAGYIGRVEAARRALTIILIPTEGDKVTAYYGLAGNIPLSDVKLDMLDRIGIFPLTRPLSEGIFFANPTQKFYLQRETDSKAPGSVLYGAVQFLDDGDVFTYQAAFFAYKEPVVGEK